MLDLQNVLVSHPGSLAMILKLLSVPSILNILVTLLSQTHTIAMYIYKLLMDYFFYILGMKEPLIIQCFEFPHCIGKSLVLTNVVECCILLRRMSYREVITGRCMDCH